jgi:hypothetical protein
MSGHAYTIVLMFVYSYQYIEGLTDWSSYATLGPIDSGLAELVTTTSNFGRALLR